MRLVKCQACGKQVEQKTAYKVCVGKANRYYCNEQEYVKKSFQDAQKKRVKDESFDKIYEIFGYTVTNTVLFNEINSIANIHTYNKVHSYLHENQEMLEKAMSKTFQSEYAKIRYFSAILKNNIQDYIPEDNVDTGITECEYDLVEIKYKPKKKRRAMADVEEEVLNE